MHLVLDEADRILDMGFKATMNAIIDNLPEDRQTLLYSATQTKYDFLVFFNRFYFNSFVDLCGTVIQYYIQYNMRLTQKLCNLSIYCTEK